MMRWGVLLLLFLSSWGAGQEFTVGVRASTLEAVVLASVEVSAGEFLGVRVAPIIQGEVRTDWRVVSFTALAGVGLTYLPSDSTFAVQANFLYRVLFNSGSVSGVPEFSIVVIW